MKKLIQFLTLTALLIGASAHAMENLEQLGRQLREAAEEGNLELVQQLLQQGAPVDATDFKGAPVDATDLSGWTPLVYAAYYGHTDVCQLLLDNKASIDANSLGGTPLLYAAGRGHTGICRLLLNNKASVEAANKYGTTPLMIAAFVGHTDTCQLLLGHGASVDATDGSGKTPLMIAADWGNTDTCHFLIDTIVTQIKNSKANAIVLLGTKRNRRPQYLNDRENNSRIDKPVIQLIARVVHASALRQQQSLFEQIHTIHINAGQQELLAYACKQLEDRPTHRWCSVQ